MKVSITGANGFIGSHLVDKLLERGAEITCLARKSSNLQWLENKPIKFVIGDLFNMEALKQLVKDADYVYHVAGVVKSKTRQGYFHGNSDATRYMLESCLLHNTTLSKFMYLSSQAAVGPSPDVDRPVDETTPYHPITTYGESKKAAEEIVMSYQNKIPVTIVRPPAVYGPRDTEIFIFFQTIEKGVNPLIGFADTRVSLIHSSDLVDGIILAGESQKSIGQIYFISSELLYGWEECGKFAAKLMGKKHPFHLRVPHVLVFTIAAGAEFIARFQKQAATLNIEKARDITQRYWTCDVSKAKRELGFTQKISLEAGFEQTIRWYRDHGWLKRA